MRVPIRRCLILLAGVLALSGAIDGIRRVKAAARLAPVAAAQQPAASASDEAVIRFVKDPEPAPAFEARDLNGNSISRTNWNGKVVLLVFWATWCGPCREEIPELIALQEQYKDSLQIIGVSVDDDPPEKIQQFAKREGLNYPVVMITPALNKAYGGVVALPTAFVIDTHGRIVQRHTGVHPMLVYTREIQSLLGLSVDARVETFVDEGQVLLKNAANATELPGVSLDGLTDAQKKAVLHRLNAETCTCGCDLTLAQCRINDSSCPVSLKIAAQVVKEVVQGSGKPGQESHSKPGNPSTE